MLSLLSPKEFTFYSHGYSPFFLLLSKHRLSSDPRRTRWRLRFSFCKIEEKKEREAMFVATERIKHERKVLFNEVQVEILRA